MWRDAGATACSYGKLWWLWALGRRIISVQREGPRIAAEVGRRTERLTIDRAVVVLARERGIADIRRVRIVVELAVARQHFGAGVEPRARGDIDTGTRALLIDPVRALRAVIAAAVAVILLLLLALARGCPLYTSDAADE